MHPSKANAESVDALFFGEPHDGTSQGFWNFGAASCNPANDAAEIASRGDDEAQSGRLIFSQHLPQAPPACARSSKAEERDRHQKQGCRGHMSHGMSSGQRLTGNALRDA
jgi:hypothetical protein